MISIIKPLSVLASREGEVPPIFLVATGIISLTDEVGIFAGFIILSEEKRLRAKHNL